MDSSEQSEEGKEPASKDKQTANKDSVEDNQSGDDDSSSYDSKAGAEEEEGKIQKEGEVMKEERKNQILGNAKRKKNSGSDDNSDNHKLWNQSNTEDNEPIKVSKGPSYWSKQEESKNKKDDSSSHT